LIQPSESVGYANGPVTKAPNWHGLVAWDMLFNNLSTGLFLVAALIGLVNPTVFMSLTPVAYLIALIVLLADLVCLVLDLGDPMRFHHMLRVFKPSSPMSLGTWALTVYSLPLTLIVAIDLLPLEWAALGWIRQIAVLVAIPPALASAVYKGVLLSTNAQPGWRDARWLGGYLASSAILLGCAQMLVLSVFAQRESAVAILRPALMALIVVNVIPFILLLVNLRTTLARVYNPRELGRAAAVSFGVGMLLPLGLLLIGNTALTILSAVLLVLVGSLFVRYAIVWLPHSIH